jgi:hypothetical protein
VGSVGEAIGPELVQVGLQVGHLGQVEFLTAAELGVGPRVSLRRVVVGPEAVDGPAN